ncbi:MAG: DUF6056 family protein [Gammaproteobacteria bacterium]
MFPDKALKTTLLISVVPFLFLFAYIHPQTDDFCSAVSMFQRGFWGHQIWAFTHFNGRYFSTFTVDLFTNAAELLGGYLKGYRFIPLSMFVVFFFALLAFVKSIAQNFISNRHIFWGTLVLFVLCLSRFPSVAEGFYWLDSIGAHLLANILLLLLLSLLFYSSSASLPGYSRKRFFYYLICLLLTIGVVGGNEVTRVVLLTIAFTGVVTTTLTKHPTSTLWRLVLGTAIIFSVMTFLTPANVLLMKAQIKGWGVDYSSTAIMLRVLKSINEFMWHFTNWVLDSALLSASILAVPYFVSLAENSGVLQAINRKHIVIAVYFILWLSLIASAFVLPYVAGEYFAARASNTGYLVFLLGWFLGIFLIIATLSTGQRKNLELPRYIYTAAKIILTVGILLEGNVPHSVKQLLNDAPYYSSQLEARYRIIDQSIEKGEEAVVVPALTRKPDIIFIRDIVNNPRYWRNGCYADFFHLQSIAITSKPSKNDYAR